MIDNGINLFRKKRLEEFKQAAMKNKYGQVINISEPDWKKEVTSAPEDIFVVVNLYKHGYFFPSNIIV